VNLPNQSGLGLRRNHLSFPTAPANGIVWETSGPVDPGPSLVLVLSVQGGKGSQVAARKLLPVTDSGELPGELLNTPGTRQGTWMSCRHLPRRDRAQSTGDGL
jgi:hypothetical protein